MILMDEIFERRIFVGIATRKLEDTQQLKEMQNYNH